MSIFFFFNDTATTEIYTLSLHDALPISVEGRRALEIEWDEGDVGALDSGNIRAQLDRKSTRLNSSHDQISYAVFCLKKKKNVQIDIHLVQPAHRIVNSVIHTDSIQPTSL